MSLKQKQTTVIIRSILRDTLIDSIKSCLYNNLSVIVVVDCSINSSKAKSLYDEILRLPIKLIKAPVSYGHYGCIAANLAIYSCDTEFITFLDDDDQLVDNASQLLYEKFDKNPDVDIWIPGAHLNDGTIRCGVGCKSKGLIRDNVVIPTYRTKVFSYIPYTIKDSEFFNPRDYTDFWHIKQCHDYGFVVDWMEFPIYKIRPNLSGHNGEGL